MNEHNPSSLVHPAYRHLDRPVRLAGLSLGQWSQLVAAGVTAWALSRVLPFGTTYDLSIAVTIAGIPVAATFAAGTGRTSPLQTLTAVIRWRRHAHVYAPGVPDDGLTGYVLAGPAPEPDGGS